VRVSAVIANFKTALNYLFRVIVK